MAERQTYASNVEARGSLNTNTGALSTPDDFGAAAANNGLGLARGLAQMSGALEGVGNQVERQQVASDKMWAQAYYQNKELELTQQAAKLQESGKYSVHAVNKMLEDGRSKISKEAPSGRASAFVLQDYDQLGLGMVKQAIHHEVAQHQQAASDAFERQAMSIQEGINSNNLTFTKSEDGTWHHNYEGALQKAGESAAALAQIKGSGYVHSRVGKLQENIARLLVDRFSDQEGMISAAEELKKGTIGGAIPALERNQLIRSLEQNGKAVVNNNFHVASKDMENMFDILERGGNVPQERKDVIKANYAKAATEYGKTFGNDAELLKQREDVRYQDAIDTGQKFNEKKIISAMPAGVSKGEARILEKERQSEIVGEFTSSMVGKNPEETMEILDRAQKDLSPETFAKVHKQAVALETLREKDPGEYAMRDPIISNQMKEAYTSNNPEQIQAAITNSMNWQTQAGIRNPSLPKFVRTFESNNIMSSLGDPAKMEKAMGRIYQTYGDQAELVINELQSSKDGDGKKIPSGVKVGMMIADPNQRAEFWKSTSEEFQKAKIGDDKGTDSPSLEIGRQLGFFQSDGNVSQVVASTTSNETMKNLYNSIDMTNPADRENAKEIAAATYTFAKSLMITKGLDAGAASEQAAQAITSKYKFVNDGEKVLRLSASSKVQENDIKIAKKGIISGMQGRDDLYAAGRVIDPKYLNEKYLSFEARDRKGGGTDFRAFIQLGPGAGKIPLKTGVETGMFHKDLQTGELLRSPKNMQQYVFSEEDILDFAKNQDDVPLTRRFGS